MPAFLNRTHFEMRSFSQDRVQHAGVVSKRQKTTPAKTARGAFFANGAKNASIEERAQGKGKTLGEESPRPSLFFYQ
ncbi:MAG: hypothetical protein H7834_11115 [Magnetococcus sp. YQC-9]